MCALVFAPQLFALQFDPELVSIADVYTTCDSPSKTPGLVRGGRATAYIGEGGDLAFAGF